MQNLQKWQIFAVILFTLQRANYLHILRLVFFQEITSFFRINFCAFVAKTFFLNFVDLWFLRENFYVFGPKAFFFIILEITSHIGKIFKDLFFKDYSHFEENCFVTSAAALEFLAKFCTALATFCLHLSKV